MCPIEAKANTKPAVKTNADEEDEESIVDPYEDCVDGLEEPAIFLLGPEEEEEEVASDHSRKRMAEANEKWSRVYDDNDDDEEGEEDVCDTSGAGQRRGKMRKTVSFSSADCWRQVGGETALHATGMLMQNGRLLSMSEDFGGSRSVRGALHREEEREPASPDPLAGRPGAYSESPSTRPRPQTQGKGAEAVAGGRGERRAEKDALNSAS